MNSSAATAWKEQFEVWERHAAPAWEAALRHPPLLAALGRTLELSFAAQQLLPVPAAARHRFHHAMDAAAAVWRRALAPERLLPIEAPAEVRTPAEVVHSDNKLRLLRYLPAGGRRVAAPVLLVPSLINRSYVLDLQPRRSLVAYLRDQGFDVWMVDWGTPGPEDRAVTLDHHVDGYLLDCVRAMLAATGGQRVSLLGYCLGGLLTTLFTALHGDLVQNLVVLASPVDFHDDGLLSLWARRETFPVDLVVDACGNMPAWLLGTSFKWLRPTTDGRNAWALAERLDDAERRDDFLALSRWAEDNVAVPGETYRKLVKDCYQDNLLVQGRMRIHGRAVDLAAIDCPLLNVTARQDHICPPGSAAVLNDKVSSGDATLLTLSGGHVGAIVGREATAGWWPTLSAWLAARC